MVFVDKVVWVVCVGDSIIFGVGVVDCGKNNYLKVFGCLLGLGYEIRNFGVSGVIFFKKGDCFYWKIGVFKVVMEYKFDIVIIKLGINDFKL